MIGLALGLPLMGKSQALQDYVRAQLTTHRFLVVDRVAEWAFDSPRWRGQRWREWTGRTAALAKVLGHSVVVEGAPWAVTAPAPGARIEAWLDSLPSTGLVRFGHPWEGDDVAELARALGSCVYVDDEVDLVALAAGWPRNPLRDFAHRGRHLPNRHGAVGQVHILGAARRAQSLHIDVTSLADLVWCFRLQGKRTLERLVDDNVLLEDDVPRVRELEPFHYLQWTADGSRSWGQLAPY